MSLGMYIAAVILGIFAFSKVKQFFSQKDNSKGNSKIGGFLTFLLSLLILGGCAIKDKIFGKKNNKDKEEPVKEEPKKVETAVPVRAAAKSYDEMTREEKMAYLRKTREDLVRQREAARVNSMPAPTRVNNGPVLTKSYGTMRR